MGLPTLGFSDADRLEAQAKARTLDPSATAVVVNVFRHPRDRCQIRVQRFEWDPDGTQVEYQALVASGRTFHDALVQFFNVMEEQVRKEEEGNEKQRKLREMGLA